MKFAEYVKALRALAEKHETKLPLKKGATTAALAKAVRALGFQPDPALQEAWSFANGSADYASLFAAPGQLTVTVQGAGFDQVHASQRSVSTLARFA